MASFRASTFYNTVELGARDRIASALRVPGMVEHGYHGSPRASSRRGWTAASRRRRPEPGTTPRDRPTDYPGSSVVRRKSSARSPARTRVALGLVAAAVLGASCGSDAGERPNVVLICMDTVRGGHLGAYGYGAHPTTPTLDALAERAIVFRDASATANWTKPSVASLMTGTYLAQHGMYEPSGQPNSETLILPSRAYTLAEAFRRGGYSTAAFVQNAQLRQGLGFEQGFDVYRDKAGHARKLRERAVEWLEERDADAPFFLYLHFLDAHAPFNALPDEYVDTFCDPAEAEPFLAMAWAKTRRAINRGEQRMEEGELQTLVGLYDAGIRYIDDELGRLFAWLELESLMENTVVCVVSDHGEELLERGKIGHGMTHDLVETLLHVPWILRVPGEEPRSIATPCSLVDLHPTLLAAAGLPPGDECRGLDLLRNPDVRRPILSEHLDRNSYQQAVRLDGRKIRRHLQWSAKDSTGGLRDVTRMELAEALARGAGGDLQEDFWTFELSEDPTERAARPTPPDDEDRRAMVEMVRSLLARRLWEEGDRVELTDENREALRKIGYAE